MVEEYRQWHDDSILNNENPLTPSVAAEVLSERYNIDRTIGSVKWRQGKQPGWQGEEVEDTRKEDIGKIMDGLLKTSFGMGMTSEQAMGIWKKLQPFLVNPEFARFVLDTHAAESRFFFSWLSCVPRAITLEAHFGYAPDLAGNFRRVPKSDPFWYWTQVDPGLKLVGYRFFRKILPYKDASIFQSKEENARGMEENGVEDYRRMLHRKVFPKTMCGLGLSLLFLAVGAGLSLLLTGSLNELVIIMTITTLAIAASFSEKVRKLPKTFELGMIFILIFSIVVASQFNIYNIHTSAFTLLYFVLYIMLVSVLLHLLFCRLGKISGDLFTVAHVGLLCSPPFIPPVVGAMGNRRVLISGIVIGLVGYAVGTYLGIGVAFILHLF